MELIDLSRDLFHRTSAYPSNPRATRRNARPVAVFA